MNKERFQKLAGLIKEGREDNERYEKADTMFGNVNIPVRKNDKPDEPKPMDEQVEDSSDEEMTIKTMAREIQNLKNRVNDLESITNLLEGIVK